MPKSNLEIKIEKIARKLNIFQAEDIEILTEASKTDIVSTIEKMVSKGILKSDKNSYIFIPKMSKSKNKQENSNPRNSECSFKVLPFRPKKPKEIYLRHINEMDGFVDYFFATQARKNKIKRILSILKETHGVCKKKRTEILKKYKMAEDTFTRYKNDISKNGLVNLVGKGEHEPGEIFYFFKEYYLSTKKYTAEESRELAILRFERLIGARINRNKIMLAHWMLKRLKKEYKKDEIEKYRTPNFSEFDVEKLFHE